MAHSSNHVCTLLCWSCQCVSYMFLSHSSHCCDHSLPVIDSVWNPNCHCYSNLQVLLQDQERFDVCVYMYILYCIKNTICSIQILGFTLSAQFWAVCLMFFSHPIIRSFRRKKWCSYECCCRFRRHFCWFSWTMVSCLAFRFVSSVYIPNYVNMYAYCWCE